jgi:hypothetical protein
VAAHGCEVKLTPRDDLGHRPPREDAETEATKQRRRANVDAYHSKLAISPHELDVRDPRQPLPANVEDLRVEDVAREQELVPGELVLYGIGGDHDLVCKRGDSRPRHSTMTTIRDVHAERNNVRIGLAETDDQVVELPITVPSTLRTLRPSSPVNTTRL